MESPYILNSFKIKKALEHKFKGSSKLFLLSIQKWISLQNLKVFCAKYCSHQSLPLKREIWLDSCRFSSWASTPSLLFQDPGHLVLLWRALWTVQKVTFLFLSSPSVSATSALPHVLVCLHLLPHVSDRYTPLCVFISASEAQLLQCVICHVVYLQTDFILYLMATLNFKL